MKAQEWELKPAGKRAEVDSFSELHALPDMSALAYRLQEDQWRGTYVSFYKGFIIEKPAFTDLYKVSAPIVYEQYTWYVDVRLAYAPSLAVAQQVVESLLQGNPAVELHLYGANAVYENGRKVSFDMFGANYRIDRTEQIQAFINDENVYTFRLAHYSTKQRTLMGGFQ